MRFIKDLDPETVNLLWKFYSKSKYNHVRRRSHCILLSFRGKRTSELMEVFSVRRATIYSWFDAWERDHLLGLYDSKGRGRKGKLTSKQKRRVKEWALKYSRNLKKVCAMIKEEFAISVGKKTVQRLLKIVGVNWRRIRTKVKGQPDVEEYEKKKKELEKLREQNKREEIDLRYFDESGFCLTPYIPYAWQEKGKTMRVESSRSKRLNVLGFLNLNGQLQGYTIEGTVDSNVVISIFDAFCQTITKRTVVVVDNASMHTSKLFQEKISEWKVNGLEIFFLPPYSPELNLIEILWRFMKYHWIEFDAYRSWNDLRASVENIIASYGEKYTINFV